MRSRHVIAVASIVAGGLLLSACGWEELGASEFSDSESLNQPVSEVRFSNDSGDVKITVGDTFEVRRSVGYHERKPGKTYRMDGDSLLLEECKERNCWVNYDVTVPEGTKVSGHLDSGDVELVGVAGVNVAAESGNVVVRDVDGEVNASTQSGNVDLSEIGGAVVAGAESGNVSVILNKSQSVTANTQSGNVDVTVPDASYQVDIRTETDNNITNDLGDDTTGPKINLGTESGNVTLRPV